MPQKNDELKNHCLVIFGILDGIGCSRVECSVVSDPTTLEKIINTTGMIHNCSKHSAGEILSKA